MSDSSGAPFDPQVDAQADPDPGVVRASVRVYCLALHAYPRQFREEYGRDLVQLFRDCCRDAHRDASVLGLAALWRDALVDLVVAATRERAVELCDGGKSLSQRTLLGGLPYFLALLFGLAIGWVNVHTDETPFVALPLLGLAGILGLAWPQRAWRWALLVGVWLALGQAYALLTSTRTPYPNDPSAVATVLCIGLALSLLGAYAGALVRRLVA